MEKILIIIENDNDMLSKISGLIKEAQSNEERHILEGIDVEGVLSKENNNNEVDNEEIISDIEEIIKRKNKEGKNNLRFHIVVDACLTQQEHDMTTIPNTLSGVTCLRAIDAYMQGLNYEYHLSIMSRFFSFQLKSLQALNDFAKDSEHFYTVIRTPFDRNAEKDTGSSPVPLYVDILPKENVYRKYTKAFFNVISYVLQNKEKIS